MEIVEIYFLTLRLVTLMAEDFKSLRIRRWCLTWNNYDDNSLKVIMNCKASYCIVGKEVGKKGTPHYQMYMEFKDGCTFSALKKRLKKCHIEVAQADEEKNREYCSKQEVIYEMGEPMKQGQRNDLKEIKDRIAQKFNIRDLVCTEVIKNYQGLRMAENLMKYFEPVRDKAPEIHWRYGEAGAGKTHYIYDKHDIKDIFVPINFKWWEGYDGHPVVLLDDIRGDFCKYHEILKVLDRYPYRVECKGGSRQLLAETIYITAPCHPEDMWYTVEDKNQLLRRLTTITRVNKKIAQKSSGNTRTLDTWIK